MWAASGEQEMIEGFAGVRHQGLDQHLEKESECVSIWNESVCFPELLKSLHTNVF